ncbi:hypothetical protein LSTR_LSTR009778 [Laodelphax striatellus]|uniref:Uncharacterized protein n=1 Tax=Laodelphax striatellus TaxID=195883 RepID=A0A482XNI3_LAOST|nr:hypothetical protein LSTR_LSTR009778 [Laodelphax striatellus]
MSSQEEDLMPNRFNKYGILFRNKENLSKPQIMEMFSVFEGDDPSVFCTNTGNRVFVNYNLKEHAIKARAMYPELDAVFSNGGKKGPDQKMVQSWIENTESDRKRGYNSKYDSDNKSCGSVASNSSLTSYSETSMAKSTMNGPTPDSIENKIDQKEEQSTKSTMNGSTPDSGENKIDQKEEQSNGNVEDSGGMPLLAFSYDVEVMEGLPEVETKVVVLSNLPPWFHTGEVYRLIHELTGLWPLEIEILHREERVVMHSAYLHFGTLKEAEDCVRGMNYKWVEYRQLICLLLDEILMTMNQ